LCFDHQILSWQYIGYLSGAVHGARRR